MAIRNSHFSIDGTIDLLGFDEFNPSQIELLTALVQNGNTVNRLTITPRNKAAVLWQSQENNSELQQMARWVRYWFEQEPDSTIAIVVPDLQARRQEVERNLEQILTPGINGAGRRAKPWNISMGAPLARLLLIEAAFDLLNLLDDRIDIQDIGRVLRSPWLRGGICERNSRALLEKCLRENYPRQLKLEEVRYRAGEIRKYDRRHRELPQEQRDPQAWNSPKLTTVLNALMQFKKNKQGTCSASAWAEALDQLLTGLRWPLNQKTKARVRKCGLIKTTITGKRRKPGRMLCVNSLPWTPPCPNLGARQRLIVYDKSAGKGFSRRTLPRADPGSGPV